MLRETRAMEGFFGGAASLKVLLTATFNFAMIVVATKIENVPKWRNWQTRWIQNPVFAGTCGFDPRLRHQEHQDFQGLVNPGSLNFMCHVLQFYCSYILSRFLRIS